MKPFNLEAAKNGEKIITGNGLPVRIICWDAKKIEYPLIALIAHEDGEESIELFTEQGGYCANVSDTDHDLFMAEPESWVNLFRRKDSRGLDWVLGPYPSKQEALDDIDQGIFVIHKGTYKLVKE